VGILVLVAVTSLAFQRIFYRLWLHPLATFPGPSVGRITTQWKAYVECVLNRSFSHVLEELHAKYGTTCSFHPQTLHLSPILIPLFYRRHSPLWTK
jgi:hypothetical protein